MNKIQLKIKNICITVDIIPSFVSDLYNKAKENNKVFERCISRDTYGNFKARSETDEDTLIYEGSKQTIEIMYNNYIYIESIDGNLTIIFNLKSIKKNNMIKEITFNKIPITTLSKKLNIADDGILVLRESECSGSECSGSECSGSECSGSEKIIVTTLENTDDDTLTIEHYTELKNNKTFIN